jgi:uncharacterized protein (DUF924 family)
VASDRQAFERVATSQAPVAPETVNRFWFEELAPRDWFRKSTKLDRQIAERFGAIHEAAAQGELGHWRVTPEGRLAEILVLDQFSRNIHRDTAQAFANDPIALALAREATDTGADRALSPQQRAFLYMPFMHSESLADHDIAIALYRSVGLKNHLDAERKHYAIIERFGRYPHRNAILGRESTAEEIAFLAEPGSAF